MFLIIGDGRVAKHFARYFSLLDLPYSQWSRRSQSVEQLRDLASGADRILLLISDSAIHEFHRDHSFLPAAKIVHFSGSIYHGQIAGAHPLMTFGPEFYDLATYQKIPFICEIGRQSFTELLPGLHNPHYAIRGEQKTFYHALCAMSGNFTTILWESIARKFTSDLGLPRDVLTAYLQQICANLINAHDGSVLTGPLQRRDVKTIIRHLDALQGQPEQMLYYSFLNYFFGKPIETEVFSDERTRL